MRERAIVRLGGNIVRGVVRAARRAPARREQQRRARPLRPLGPLRWSAPAPARADRGGLEPRRQTFATGAPSGDVAIWRVGHATSRCGRSRRRRRSRRSRSTATTLLIGSGTHVRLVDLDDRADEDDRARRRRPRGRPRPDGTGLRRRYAARQVDRPRRSSARGTGHVVRRLPEQRDPLVRVQPEREAARQRQLRPHGADLGCAHRAAPPRPAAPGLCARRELLARRQHRS